MLSRSLRAAVAPLRRTRRCRTAIRRHLVIPAGILLLWVVPGQAVTYTDTFDALDPAVWSTFTFGNPGSFTVEALNGELHLRKNCACGGASVKGGGLGTKFRLSGDFTITVDFRWGLFPNRNQAQINISQPGVGFRYDMGNGKGTGVPTGQIIYFNYVPADVYLNPSARVNTTDTRGTFRLQRTGSVFTAFYRSFGSTTFTQIPRPVSVTSADITFELILQNNGVNNVSEVFYDNLVVEAADIKGLALPGAAEGRVLASCPVPDTGLLGATVDVYDLAVGPDGEALGELAGTSVTDLSGTWSVGDLKVGDYVATVHTPLGYEAIADEIPFSITSGQTTTVDFSLDCVEVTSTPRGIGYWKHQIGVATGGRGSAQLDAETLCGYLDAIEAHFNSNAVNQVVVYEPPASGLCADKLDVAKELINLRGDVGTLARARQQLLALLFNAAAQNLGLMTPISDDGATVSQAITFCDQLIDDPAGDHDTAKNVAEAINGGEQVAAGVIPRDTANIAYARPRDAVTLRVSPNPGGPLGYTMALRVPSAGPATLAVYDVAGRHVATLLSGGLDAGRHEVAWSGEADDGRSLGRGVYFARLSTVDGTRTAKIVHLGR